MIDGVEDKHGVIDRIRHPQRKILHCLKRHRDFGNSCRHDAYPHLTGDYCFFVDDDNYLAHDGALRDLSFATAPWAIFPIQRQGRRFYSDPPQMWSTDTGNFILRRPFALWPALPYYDTDGRFVTHLANTLPYQPFPRLRPPLIMPYSSVGAVSHGHRFDESGWSGRPKVSIVTVPVRHTPDLQSRLTDSYLSIQGQDFWEWVVYFPYGSAPTNFNDHRVRPQFLPKPPSLAGGVLAHVHAQVQGDVVLELSAGQRLTAGSVSAVEECFCAIDRPIDRIFSNSYWAYIQSFYERIGGYNLDLESEADARRDLEERMDKRLKESV